MFMLDEEVDYRNCPSFSTGIEFVVQIRTLSN
mgnify:CR=1 FL=1